VHDYLSTLHFNDNVCLPALIAEMLAEAQRTVNEIEDGLRECAAALDELPEGHPQRPAAAQRHKDLMLQLR
jgi:hypothetical protein